VTNAHVISSAPPSTATSEWLEQAGSYAIFGVAAALQFSIAIAQSILVIAALCWIALLIVNRESVTVPRFFWPLAAYAGATLASSAFSAQPLVSFIDCKQLLLFLIVPLVYRLMRGRGGSTIITLIVSVGAASAAIGIFQYGVLQYDHLGLRPRGTLGHYMTYSGLLMLVIGCALARILFGKRDRLWAALVMPALAVAVGLSFSRSAGVGACAAAALLLALKDFRLVAILPIVVGLLLALAPARVTQRFVSTFDMSDPTIRDRVAMLREGERMVHAHPIFGVGPNMVQPLYAEFRGEDAVEKVNPHLHNVPMQIAAERGLPALVIWLGFIGLLVRDLAGSFKGGQHRVLAAAALAAVAAMLMAGMFEYNFGDSEFLMLFLILVTMPFAAARPPLDEARGDPEYFEGPAAVDAQA
jgi:putative inorganic carbon (hco3(-)) transporter